MRFLVVGARMAGAASALALHKLGHEVLVVDRANADPRLVTSGIEVILGEPDPERILSNVDEVVVSPGIPDEPAGAFQINGAVWRNAA